jgi:hypothetical protein
MLQSSHLKKRARFPLSPPLARTTKLLPDRSPAGAEVLCIINRIARPILQIWAIMVINRFSERESHENEGIVRDSGGYHFDYGRSYRNSTPSTLARVAYIP